jgi:hypothetical protein
MSPIGGVGCGKIVISAPSPSRGAGRHAVKSVDDGAGDAVGVT